MDQDQEDTYAPHTAISEWNGEAVGIMQDSNVERVLQDVHEQLDRWFPTGRRIRVARDRVRYVLAYYAENFRSEAVWSLDDLNRMVVETVCIHVYNDLQDDYTSRREGVHIQQDAPRWDPNIQRYEPTAEIQRVSDPASFVLERKRPVFATIRY
jgi:hypothetical protein